MSSVSVEKEIKSRGYLNFRVLKNSPLACVIKSDKTLIVAEVTVQKIIKVGSNQGEIFSTISTVAYTDSNVRAGTSLQQEQDVAFEVIQEGEVVFKMENGITVSLVPVIVQINLPGVRLPYGEVQYDVVTVAKTKIRQS